MSAIDFTHAAGAVSAIAGVGDYALICFSDLRWNPLQRPQPEMSRFARDHRVIFWEEPVTGESDEATLNVRTCGETGVIVVTPQLPRNLAEGEQQAKLKSLLEIYLAGQQVPLVRWYRTPAMLGFSRHIDAVCTVYERGERPAAFTLAPRWVELERELLGAADLVFDGNKGADGLSHDTVENRHPCPARVEPAFCGAGARH